jgi:hypothetical protein
MLDKPAIASALFGLVGYRETAAQPLSGVLGIQLKESRSGLFVQDYNELLHLSVLAHIAPRTESLESWLTRLTKDALIRLVGALTSAQQLDGKVLLSGGLSADSSPVGLRMIKTPGNRANTVNKLSRFVGVQLQPMQKLGIAFSVPSMSIQLDGVLTEPLPLYVYTDSQPEPLFEFVINPGNKANFPYALPLNGVTLPSGGTYWVGYYEDDLPLGVRAIPSEIGPCGCADDPFAKWSKYVTARAFSVPALALDEDRTLFDTAQVSTETASYGLNLDFFSYCDVATALKSTDNQDRLAEAVQMALAVRLFEAIGSSPNVTQLTGRPDVQDDAKYALFVAQAKLYGGKVPGTEEAYPSLLGKLTLDLSGLDAACGPPAKPSLLSMGRLSR